MQIKTHLINRKHCREFALEVAKTRAHKFTQVGSNFFLQCEANLKTFIRSQVQSHPSKGKTIN